MEIRSKLQRGYCRAKLYLRDEKTGEFEKRWGGASKWVRVRYNGCVPSSHRMLKSL